MTDPDTPRPLQPAAVQAAELIIHLQSVTQALAAVRQQSEVFNIILNDALQALAGIGGAILLVQKDQLCVAARRGHDVTSVWQDGHLGERRPGSDALRTNTPLFFSQAGDLVAAYPNLEAHTGGVAAVASAVLPMVEGGRPLGVIVLDFREPHDFTPDEEHFLITLAGQCALALDRAQLSGNLERQVSERTAELEAFVRFTELADGETDVLALASRAEEVLSVLFPGCTNGYYALEGGLWKLKVHSADLEADPALLTSLKAGLPLDTPIFAQARRGDQAVFVDSWNPEQEQIAFTEAYQRVATYPLLMDGTAHAMFALGLKDNQRWSAHHQAVFRSVGRSLSLALERSAAARHLEEQNAELHARTQALEGVAALTRDLTQPGSSEHLINQVMQLVLGLLPPGYAAYWQIQGGRWQLVTSRGEAGRSAWQAARERGFQGGQFPSLDQPWQTGQPYFQNHYDPSQDANAELMDHLLSAATLPVVVRGKTVGVFGVALFGQRDWSAADRALLATAVQSLGLGLERAEQTQQLSLRNAELYARTQALEGFAELTRDLSLSSDPRTLIECAMQLVRSLLPPGFAAFWQMTGQTWQATSQVGAVGKAELQDGIDAGLSVGQTPSLDLPYRTREPTFQDDYDHGRDVAAELVNHLSTVASLPVLVNGSVSGIFNVALFEPHPWSAADRAVLITTVQSLGLALERAEQARRLTDQRDLLQASNEELEAFTYSVSHDLRTPVRHIISFGALLRRSLPETLGEKAERYFKVVEDSALNLNRLIDGMLELSRTSRQPLRISNVDLGRLVATAHKEVMAAAGNRQITWQVAELPEVPGDADLLRRVVIALLSNAVKYTRTRKQAAVEIWAEEQPKAWKVFVRDNGVGFDPHYQDKLFTVFQRLHRQEDFEGAGVNLANARRIITRHGGSMSAQGQPNAGATFAFTLPKAEEDLKTSAQTTA